MKNDLSKKYSKGTIIIHWLTAILIIVLFFMGKYMEGLQILDKMGLIKIHVILGIVVFLLTMVRSYLFFKAPKPKPLKTNSKWNDRLVICVHNTFYIILFLISLSGITAVILGGYGVVFGTENIELIKSPEQLPPLKIHGLLAFMMMVLLLFHVVGVIKHYILTGENTLRRIT